MSVPGFVESLFGGLDPDLKRVLIEAFREVMLNGRLGPIDHQVKSENFQAFYVNSTTAASTGEFSIVHGMGRTPYLMKIVTDLSAVGAGTPTLRVSRAADGQRIYLKADAGSTSLPFTVYLE